MSLGPVSTLTLFLTDKKRGWVCRESREKTSSTFTVFRSGPPEIFWGVNYNFLYYGFVTFSFKKLTVTETRSTDIEERLSESYIVFLK